MWLWVIGNARGLRVGVGETEGAQGDGGRAGKQGM